MAQPDVNTLSLEYLERLYAQYVEQPERVPLDWRSYFDQLSSGDGRAASSTRPASPAPRHPPHDDLQVARRQECVDQLIREYRVRGHMIAQVDPLGEPRPELAELDPCKCGLTEADWDRPFSTSTLPGPPAQTLRSVLDRLRSTYCGFIGAQFMHIHDLAAREWLQRRMEDTENRLKLSRGEQIRILTRLTDAAIFEEFIRRKFVGAKSFSLEGAESLIPLLDRVIEKAGQQGVQEVVMAMPHRGRLNVLANIIGKSPREIFREFDDAGADADHGRGDVQYHLGYHNDWTTLAGRKIHLTLCFNPSHLEFGCSAALGLARARQDRGADLGRERVMAVLIHGDAAFAGEGIVQETLNLSQLAAYTTGGALHIIVNNQIGFTTPPEEARSSPYTSDMAKMLQVPVFHVNGEHPEAVAQVVHLAMDFRKTFRRDALIDMYCYRRWGHNEGDEPSFTQPLLYKAIERRKSVRESYLEHLLKLGEVTQEEADKIALRRRDVLERELSQSRQPGRGRRVEVLGDWWKGYYGGRERPEDDVETGVDREELAGLLDRLTRLPEGFHLHRKLQRLMEGRRAMAAGLQPLDWSAAEALAVASLAAEGYRVRLGGQDSARGTFSHRHAVLHDTEDGHTYVPLQHVAADQAPVDVFNSPLSEAGVLGFEYGYSLGYPDGLIVWEAQYGDFVNAAQVIVDQFIASAEAKWQHLSGLVLLLPHGFEGQGPEHSSARVERLLQLAAEDNVQIVVPGTPAQYFHVLRRQVKRRWQKPLVVLTPKGLLRHPRNVSPLEDFAAGRFQRVLPDAGAMPTSAWACEPHGHEDVAMPPRPSRILLCTGKIYYELLERREAQNRKDVALVRLEQLYPFPRDQLASALERYPDGTPVYWVQEEPENMGAWRYLKHLLGERLLGRFPFSGVSRPESGSPATGSHKRYRLEQQELLARALGKEG